MTDKRAAAEQKGALSVFDNAPLFILPYRTWKRSETYKIKTAGKRKADFQKACFLKKAATLLIKISHYSKRSFQCMVFHKIKETCKKVFWSFDGLHFEKTVLTFWKGFGLPGQTQIDEHAEMLTNGWNFLKAEKEKNHYCLLRNFRGCRFNILRLFYLWPLCLSGKNCV